MGTDPERYRERIGDRQRAIWGTNSDDPNLQRGINPPMGHRLWPDKKQKPDLKTRNLYQGKLAELSHKVQRGEDSEGYAAETTGKQHAIT